MKLKEHEVRDLGQLLLQRVRSAVRDTTDLAPDLNDKINIMATGLMAILAPMAATAAVLGGAKTAAELDPIDVGISLLMKLREMKIARAAASGNSTPNV